MHKLQHSVETNLGVFSVRSEKTRFFLFKSPRTYAIPANLRKLREQGFVLYWRANGPLKSSTEDAQILSAGKANAESEWRAAGASDILEVLHRIVLLILSQPNGVETLLGIRLASCSVKGVFRSNPAIRPSVLDDLSLSESVELRVALTTSFPTVDPQHFRLFSQYLRMIE
jgi:hypothetical protein